MGAIAVTPTGLVFVTLRLTDRVARITAAVPAVVNCNILAAQAPDAPRGIAVRPNVPSPPGEVWVTSSGSAEVWVVDYAGNPLPAPPPNPIILPAQSPRAIAFSPDGEHAYVTIVKEPPTETHQFAVIRADDRLVLDTYDYMTGPECRSPRGVSAHPSQPRVFVTCGSNLSNTVVVMDVDPPEDVQLEATIGGAGELSAPLAFGPKWVGGPSMGGSGCPPGTSGGDPCQQQMGECDIPEPPPPPDGGFPCSPEMP